MKVPIACLIACALAAPAAAQTTAPVYDGSSVAGTPGAMIEQTADGRKIKLPIEVPHQCDDTGNNCGPVSTANPLKVGTTLPVIAAASSTPLTFSTTTATTVGPWTMQLGRSYVIAFAITGGTASIAVTTTTDGVCADGYQLSSANATYIRGAFTNLAPGRYRENLGSETQVGAQLCATITPASGATVTGSIGQ